MKRSIVFVVLMGIVILTSACGRHEEAVTGTQVTGTFAPPEPQPGELGTDAMTQTIELSDGRSENEGGALTDPSVTAETSTTTTSKSTPPPPRKQ